MNPEEKEFKEEIRREFQLERMILFSDAVFAIVITLMAIEIKLPEHSSLSLGVQLLHLLPMILAYAISFLFIGTIWYQHLQIFGLLKDYDKRLVIYNLLMLFFIGLFPFSISLVATKSGSFSLAPHIIYLTLVGLCKAMQTILEHYILIKKPSLRIKKDIQKEIKNYKENRLAFIMLASVSFLTMITFSLINQPEYKSLAWFWFFPFPFILKYFQKKIK